MRPSRRLTVGVFAFAGTGRLLATVLKQRLPRGSTAIDLIDVTMIEEGRLRAWDVLVFPGGSGSAMSNVLGARGRQAVCGYVSNGGGYLGICAGAFLASSQYDWSLSLIPLGVLTSSLSAKGDPYDSLWYRGSPTIVKLEIAPHPDCPVFGRVPPRRLLNVYYHNGPIFFDSVAGTRRVHVLARYRSEVSRCSSQHGTMVNTPAMACTCYGNGRVVVIGPHFEHEPAHFNLITAALRWCAKDEP
jgi:glutamine amidotransferase-like uncharacterized protein